MAANPTNRTSASFAPIAFAIAAAVLTCVLAAGCTGPAAPETSSSSPSSSPAVTANGGGTMQNQETTGKLQEVSYSNSGDSLGNLYSITTAEGADGALIVIEREARMHSIPITVREYRAPADLLERIERISPDVLLNVKGTSKDVCANVDMYSGLVYTMLGIPDDLFTPLFACARMGGWAAHRFEEIVAGKRIIRPAYKTSFGKARTYVPIDER